MGDVSEEMRRQDDEDDNFENIVVVPVFSCTASSPTQASPADDKHIYCDRCKMKYEGYCPQHGPSVYVDTAETNDVSKETPGHGSKNSKRAKPDVITKEKKTRIKKQHKIGNSSMAKVTRRNISSSCIESMPDVCDTSIDYKHKLHNIEDSKASNKTFSVHENNVKVSEKSLKLQVPTILEAEEIQSGESVIGYDLQVPEPSLFLEPGGLEESVKRFQCDLCHAFFSLEGSLKRHQKIHTGVKPHKCDDCGISFGRLSNLKRHKRSHTGERPYKCDICGACFLDKGHFKAHVRVHTGEKPYGCDVCGARFARTYSLQNHIRIHTGEKPYFCPNCGMRFTRHNHLQRHKKKSQRCKKYVQSLTSTTT